MNYLFEVGGTWHIYAEDDKRWSYYRLEQVVREELDKEEGLLPGPLGRLEQIKELEESNALLKRQKEETDTRLQEAKARCLELEKQLEDSVRDRNERLEQAGQDQDERLKQTEQEWANKLKQAEKERDDRLRQMEKEHELALRKKQAEAEGMRKKFEDAYRDLQNRAEEIREEGLLWRQRYLDLAYRRSTGNKG